MTGVGELRRFERDEEDIQLLAIQALSIADGPCRTEEVSDALEVHINPVHVQLLRLRNRGDVETDGHPDIADQLWWLSTGQIRSTSPP